MIKEKQILKDTDLANINGGVNNINVTPTFLALISQYPELVQITNARQNGDNVTYEKLVAEFIEKHPELAYLFN